MPFVSRQLPIYGTVKFFFFDLLKEFDRPFWQVICVVEKYAGDRPDRRI
jgi:hypothetical protein